MEQAECFLAELLNTARENRFGPAQLNEVCGVGDGVETCAEARGNSGVEPFDLEPDGYLAGRGIDDGIRKVRGIDEFRPLDEACPVELRDAVQAAEGRADGNPQGVGIVLGDT